MKRRDFLRTGIAGTAAIGLSPAILSACTTNDPLHDFGIISGVIKNELEVDPRDTLEKIAEMGYKYLEFGGTFGMEVSELKTFLSGIGLKPLAGGSSMAAFQDDGLQRLIDQQLEMDKKYLVCYWPWMHSAEEITMDDLKFAVEQFHRIGEACNKSGLRFAYHNHDHEFRMVGESYAYDYYLSNTDPDLVTMQFDVYWASVGGADPAEYIQKYPGRFELLHVKDAYDLSNRQSFACVGEGVIDFERIFRLRDTGGFKHLIVEKDGAVHGIECAQTSIEHLNSLNF
ncbi:MAG: TIM barrel protein [Bacteroidales bacterium]|nr:TIM barrel protein [Bacteroidales bacterium]